MITDDKHDMIERIKELEKRIESRDETLRRKTERIVKAKENMSLKSCPNCQHLHMQGHICYECGHDYYPED